MAINNNKIGESYIKIIVNGTSREDETSANLIIVSLFITTTNCQHGTCENA